MTPMTLYLIRHAIAAERGEAWPDDVGRPISPKGGSRFEAGVRGMVWLGVDVDLILSSPLTRARQTAAMLAVGLDLERPVEVLPALAPGHAPGAVVQALRARTRDGRIAVVGHEPDLGRLAGHLVGSPQPIPLKKGGACCIEVARFGPRPAGELRWLLTPRMLRRLGAPGV